MWLCVQLHRGSDAAGKILESSPACTSTPQPPRPASTSTAKPSFPPLFFFNIIKGYFPPPVVFKMLGFPAPIWHDKHQMPRKHHQIPSNAHQMHHQMHQKTQGKWAFLNASRTAPQKLSNNSHPSVTDGCECFLVFHCGSIVDVSCKTCLWHVRSILFYFGVRSPSVFISIATLSGHSRHRPSTS